ncbi:MAG: DUF4197 domain-containing protein [Lentimicrobiaceae bacterium]|nr:DUF4197 domain-containing protein [Lentimicrobiaceae bacterium]
MKKHIYLSLLAMIAIFFSCIDNSEFEEQLFTHDETSTALRDCINLTIDTTLNLLCVVDTINEMYGFYHFENGAYRIELPTAAKAIVDTLEKYDYGETISALIFDMNRAAELCGNNIKRFWDPVVKEMTFPNPNLVLRGGNNAITNYVKETRQWAFNSALVSSILIEKFNDLNIITKWNELQEIYHEKTGIYSSIDILTPATQQMTSSFFKRMALAEEEIRKNPELRGPTNGLLYKVFATL